ncbi:putative F-box protein At3g23260 [Triticum aestivum]|uniref:putative F-box protein At3g23260 n=1 Tax=Triticum aestivum TaxID=4565 RepID=UPI001D02A1AC|nr:putative F-box protein At3g23260 [Triticum aestivum]
MEQPSLKRRHQTGYSALPEELLVEIFARLPAKSVRRFRCLSRSWAATLSSSSFTNLHLERANQREDPPKLLFTTAQYRFHAWRHGTGSVAAEQLTAGVLPLPRLEPDCAVEVLTAKPCHGLVLLRRKYFRGYYLCNPCTGELSLLPDSEIPSKIMFGRQRRHSNNSLVAYGLGYSSKAKQHKVVRIISLHDEGTASCEVLPLDGVSVHWRPAAHQPAASCDSHHASVARPEAAVFFNGHLHFLQHHRQGHGVITTFDVSDESFGSLSAPPGLENVPFGLAVLDGCLCAHYNGLSPSGDDPFYISRLVRASGQWSSSAASSGKLGVPCCRRQNGSIRSKSTTTATPTRRSCSPQVCRLFLWWTSAATRRPRRLCSRRRCWAATSTMQSWKANPTIPWDCWRRAWCR